MYVITKTRDQASPIHIEKELHRNVELYMTPTGGYRNAYTRKASPMHNEILIHTVLLVVIEIAYTMLSVLLVVIDRTRQLYT